MGESNEHAIKRSGNIQCIEVLVSKKFANSEKGLRPLSVYSLENQPVKKSIRNSEVFHFMLYDWKRTIQKVLEENQVAYSVIRLFNTETVYGDHIEERPEGEGDLFSTGEEYHDVSYATELEEAG